MKDFRDMRMKAILIAFDTYKSKFDIEFEKIKNGLDKPNDFPEITSKEQYR